MKHILLVEDDIALGQGIAMALQIPETEITVCRGLREARQALSGRTFILLILDINLPDGSGLTLLRERKALRPEVPVLLLTANDLELDEVDTQSLTFTSTSGDISGELLHADEFGGTVTTVSGDISGIRSGSEGTRTFKIETVSGDIDLDD